MKPIPAVFLDYVAGLEAHDVERIAATMADNLRVVTGDRHLGKAEFLPFLRALYAAFPDWRYDHDPPEWHGDLIAVRWRQGGTHLGEFCLPGMLPIAPTGKQVTIPAQYFRYRVGNDKLVLIQPEAIAGGAPRGILEQIGATDPAL